MKDDSWVQKSYNELVDSAWLKFKMNLADDMVKGLDDISDLPAGETSDWVNPLIMTAPNGKRLGCWVAKWNGNKKLIAVMQLKKDDEEEETFSPDFEWVKYTNADEAANFASEILRDKWEVLHPSFLRLSRNPEIIGQDNNLENQISKNDSTNSSASVTKLRDLVGKTLSEMPGNPFTFDEDMHFAALTPEGLLLGISVRSSQIIEFWARLAFDVDEEVVREVVFDLIEEPCPHKFYPYGRSIIMALHMPCVPFEKKLFVRFLASLITEAEKYAEKARDAIERCEPSVIVARESYEVDPDEEEYWEEVDRPDLIMRHEADLYGAKKAAHEHSRQLDELKEKLKQLEQQLLASESQNHEAKKREETLLKVHRQQVDLLKMKLNEMQAANATQLREVQSENSDLKQLIQKRENELFKAKDLIVKLITRNKEYNQALRRIRGGSDEFS